MIPTRREMYRELAREIEANITEIVKDGILRNLRNGAARSAFRAMAFRVYYHSEYTNAGGVYGKDVVRLAVYLGRLARIMGRRPRRLRKPKKIATCSECPGSAGSCATRFLSHSDAEAWAKCASRKRWEGQKNAS